MLTLPHADFVIDAEGLLERLYLPAGQPVRAGTRVRVLAERGVRDARLKDIRPQRVAF